MSLVVAAQGGGVPVRARHELGAELNLANLPMLLGAALLVTSFGACAPAEENPPIPPVAQDREAREVDPDECSVRLTIDAAEVSRWGATSYSVRLSGVLHNSGERTVTLVAPGDGSTLGWRTPMITHEVKALDGTPQVLERGILIDSHLNPLKREEVFDLPAGESRLIEGWLGLSGIRKAGVYEITVGYWNDPKMEWKGDPLRPHDPATMERVRASTPCRVTSNTIVVEVEE